MALWREKPLSFSNLPSGPSLNTYEVRGIIIPKRVLFSVLSVPYDLLFSGGRFEYRGSSRKGAKDAKNGEALMKEGISQIVNGLSETQ